MKRKPLNLLMNEMEGVIHLISKIKKSNMKAFNKLCERSLRSIKNGMFICQIFVFDIHVLSEHSQYAKYLFFFETFCKKIS